MVPSVPPLQAAIGGLVASVVSVIVGFGVIDNSTAGLILSLSTSVLSSAFVIVNSLHHAANAKAVVAKLTSRPSGK